jgi:hypothetical protein
MSTKRQQRGKHLPVYAFRGQKVYGNQGFSAVVDGVAE